MLMHHMTGPLLGNIIIIALFGLSTVACFVVSIALLLYPGEKDTDHPKYRVLRDDR
ncbi:hypothetical protein [Pusillimonas sp. ANT_WB101]|uniref:hypothetical protein n=1 Tax=Pusillimonas sp. ANT_WB101 TaxID=2597356 RepID=UPI00165E4D8A|nr:hypothetical protein [Pusillimonas sp. ANT_WB101]